MSALDFGWVKGMKMRTNTISALLLGHDCNQFDRYNQTQFARHSERSGQVARCRRGVIRARWRLGNAPPCGLGLHLCVRRFGPDREPEELCTSN